MEVSGKRIVMSLMPCILLTDIVWEVRVSPEKAKCRNTDMKPQNSIHVRLILISFHVKYGNRTPTGKRVSRNTVSKST